MTGEQLRAFGLAWVVALGAASCRPSPRAVEDALRRAAAERDACPGGIPALQGTWVFIGPSRLDRFEDTIAFTGPRYIEEMRAGDPHTGERVHVEGRVACVGSNRLLFEVHRAEPNGAFGTCTGSAYACDLLWPEAPVEPPRMLLVCYPGWNLDPTRGLDYEYERVR